jgi:hypothetical protein
MQTEKETKMVGRIFSSPFCGVVLGLFGLALSESCDSLRESVLGDEPGPAYTVFRLRRKDCVAAVIEIEFDDLGQSVAAHVETFAILQALEECKLLLVHLEEFRISLPVKGRVFEEQK